MLCGHSQWVYGTCRVLQEIHETFPGQLSQHSEQTHGNVTWLAIAKGRMEDVMRLLDQAAACGWTPRPALLSVSGSPSACGATLHSVLASARMRRVLTAAVLHVWRSKLLVEAVSVNVNRLAGVLLVCAHALLPCMSPSRKLDMVTSALSSPHLLTGLESSGAVAAMLVEFIAAVSCRIRVFNLVFLAGLQ